MNPTLIKKVINPVLIKKVINPVLVKKVINPAIARKVIREGAGSIRLSIVALSLLILAGCAATPKAPSAALQAAETAIASADQAGVSSYASPELTQARDKLNAARTAVRDEDMQLALWLAEEAQVEAELASAKAEVAKAEVVNAEMQTSIDTLNQEMQRNRGIRP